MDRFGPRRQRRAPNTIFLFQPVAGTLNIMLSWPTSVGTTDFELPPELVNFTLTINGTVIDTAPATCVPVAPSTVGSVMGLITQTPGNGTASAQLTVGTTPGTYVATAVGTVSGVTESVTLTVAGAVTPATPGGGLPATGADGIGTTTQIAIGLFVVGLGLFGVAQIRRRQTSVA